MRRTAMSGALALTVGALLSAGAVQPPGAAAEPRPRPGKAGPAEAERDALASLAARPAAALAGAHDAFEPASTTIDDDGTRHVRLDRTYRDLPVLGGDVIVHSAPDGGLRDTTLTLKQPLSLSTEPQVSAGAATETAERLFRGERHGSTADLVVDATGGTPELVWQVEVDGIAPDQSPSHFNVLVGARTGEAGQTWNDFHTATGTGDGYHVGDVELSTTPADGGHRLADPERGNGEVRDANNTTGPRPIPDGFGTAMTDADNAWGSGTLDDRATLAVDAAYGMQETWDYFREVHGRDGIRDDGAGAVSYVHWGRDYANAGWSDESFAMYYGDGATGEQPFTQLDIMAHEMSHGVTAATAGLTYFGESGGLNEATSDIFGTLAEFHSGTPADPPDYLIGEKLDTRGDGTPLRWMDEPGKDGESQNCWTTGTRDLDPHLSSGVGNHFFYLLAAGSGTSAWGDSPTCDGSSVDGIGNADAGDIWYRALTVYMNSRSTYSSARTATVRAARDLFGADSTQCATVERAWNAVDVAPTTVGCATTPQPDDPDNLLRNGGFEAGDTGWTATPGVITDSSSGSPYSGGFYAWLGGRGDAHTDTLTQSVTIPAGAPAPELAFQLAVSTRERSDEPDDTMTVQVVSDSGTSTLATYSNLTPGDYAPRVFDLSAFAGQTVTIGFTATEDVTIATDFTLDDVAVTTG